MTQEIPNTDDLHVALMAATFRLIEGKAKYVNTDIKGRLQHFIDSYEILEQLITRSADQARAVLEARESG